MTPYCYACFPGFVFEHWMPQGFQDSTWGNDTCPSIERKYSATTLKVHIEFADPKDREPGCARYTCYSAPNDECIEGPEFETEHWEDVLIWIGYRERLMAAIAVRAKLQATTYLIRKGGDVAIVGQFVDSLSWDDRAYEIGIDFYTHYLEFAKIIKEAAQ